MPTSTPYAVPIVASVLRQLKPASVLDVGVGFGKYGFVVREYLDVWDISDYREYGKDRWRTRLEGIEATSEYITPLQEYLYDTIHRGEAQSVIDGLGQYDVIVMGDVLEHFEKDEGRRLVRKLYDHADRCVLLMFPPDCDRNEDVLGNPYESHRSGWNRRDFSSYENVAFRVLEGRTAMVALTKPGCVAPILTPSFAGRARTGWKGWVSRSLVRVMGADRASAVVSRVTGRKIVLAG